MLTQPNKARKLTVDKSLLYTRNYCDFIFTCKKVNSDKESQLFGEYYDFAGCHWVIRNKSNFRNEMQDYLLADNVIGSIYHKQIQDMTQS